MSKRRWTVWLRPPIALVAGVPVVLGAVLVACSGARLTPSAGPSDLPGSMAPVDSGQPVVARPQVADLAGKTWLAEGPRGWEAGQIGGRSISLGRGEIGIATRDSWIVSAKLRPTHAVTLLLRDGPTAEPSVIELGSLAPTASVIVGD